RLRFSGPKTSIICSPMTSLKTSIKTITYLSDIGYLEIQGASLVYVWFRTGQRQLTGFGVYIQTPSCMRFERYTEQSNTFHQQGRKVL
ncbi:hypothetical protein U9199_22580, partial [Escherichia coli]